MTAHLSDALTHARGSTVEAIAEGMLEEGFLGISGDPLVGKTTLARRAAALLTHEDRAKVVWIDVEGAYSIAKLAARWRHALFTAVTGPVAASHAMALERDLWPGSTRSAVLAARQLLGDAFDASLRSSPGKGDRTANFDEVLGITVKLASQAKCVLVFDHIHAPLLTYKHPIDSDDLLWQVRAASQNAASLNVVVLCTRELAGETIAGPKGAFYGDGRWLDVQAPTRSQWQWAARQAGIEADEELLDLARGHVPTAFQLLGLARPGRKPRLAFKDAASTQHEHAARCLLHATTLHRLGAHVLVSVANGEGPYAATPEAKSGDIARAVRQLVLAGLIRRDPDDARGWILVDPLVQWLLCEPMNVRPEEPMPDLAPEPEH